MSRSNRIAGVVFLCATIGMMAACGEATEEGIAPGAGNGGENDTGQVVPLDDAVEDDAGTIAEDAGGDPVDVGAEPDAGSGGDPDVVETDSSTDEPDAGVDAGPDTANLNCPGGVGCDCDDNTDCDNAVCIQTAAGKKCAKPCVDTCDKGWTCTQIGATDTVFVCVPDFVSLCAPCQKSADCEVQGVKSLCLDYGDKGQFCGGPCKGDDSCPSGYECLEAEDGEGNKAKQCKLKGDATCKCGKWAIDVGNKMACTVDNKFGSCPGTSHCTDAGMSACNGAEPAEEICDGIDSDCDGKTDVLPDSAKCSLKAFFDAGSKTACKADADCSAAGEACDEQAGVCKKLIGECFGTPVCTVGGTTECTKVKTPKPEVCNVEDDDCDGATDEDFGWSDPASGGVVAVGAACGSGPCAGGVVKCASQIKADCDSADKASKETCDGADNDCNGKIDDGACDDGDACTSDVCDGQSCSNAAAADCDDNNQCTADSCDKAAGQCVNKAITGSCDDGDACTVGDACGLAAGATPTCEAGKEKKACDDSSPCTDDSCDPGTGCVNLANAVTLACFSGEAKTKGVGLCVGGTQFCKDGKLGAECVGEVLANKDEACEGKDDNCNGITDEGCKPENVDVSFAAAFGSVGGGDKGLLVEVGGSSPVGRAQGANKTGEFGFIAWLMSVWK